jgi:hypothetical protein
MDSSALAKRYLNEAGSDQVKEIIASASSVVEKTGDVSLLMKTVPLLDAVAKTSEESFRLRLGTRPGSNLLSRGRFGTMPAQTRREAIAGTVRRAQT